MRAGLRPSVPALARFEWADRAVYASDEEVPACPERLTVNPTLHVLEHPFRRCAPALGGGAGRQRPVRSGRCCGATPGGGARSPMPANRQVLLVLEMAVEGLSPGGPRSPGMPLENVLRAVEQCAGDGLVLRPAASGGG